MSGLSALFWLAGFVGLGIWLLHAVRRARQPEAEPAPRTHVLLAAALSAALAVLAAHGFGSGVAKSGRARIRAAETESSKNAAAPARARVLLRWVQLHLEPSEGKAELEAVVGYTPDASLRLPRGYGLAEAQRGWDLLRLRAFGTTGLHAEPIAPPEPTSTRVLLAALPESGGTPQARLSRAA
ncbi:MAG TPA: hypothetical protein VKN99_22945, partial [Polyangia bacterium]|nr:hypothetical protein [Polyangia bacterium]